MDQQLVVQPLVDLGRLDQPVEHQAPAERLDPRHLDGLEGGPRGVAGFEPAVEVDVAGRIVVAQPDADEGILVRDAIDRHQGSLLWCQVQGYAIGPTGDGVAADGWPQRRAA